jgi:plasmid stabilization system protein ParE
MTLPVVFRRAARAEFDDAADWYNSRHAGLGDSFVDAVQDTLDRIRSQPKLYAKVFRDIQEALVTGFPYCVYYRERAGRIVVLSVFHTARNPSIWQHRI